jgi:putative membrane protein
MNLRIEKNDRKARILILTLSIIVFAAVVLLSRVQVKVDLGFNVHLFAKANAVINTLVAILLLVGLYLAKSKLFEKHKKVMLTAMFLSLLFLVSYICHHLFAGDTKFGDLDNNGIVSEVEKIEGGSLRYVYYVLLITHIPLAGIILPFILFTAYRGLINENKAHRKLAKITWPVWFYVAVSGPVIYLMISPYYH